MSNVAGYANKELREMNQHTNEKYSPTWKNNILCIFVFNFSCIVVVDFSVLFLTSQPLNLDKSALFDGTVDSLQNICHFVSLFHFHYHYHKSIIYLYHYTSKKKKCKFHTAFFFKNEYDDVLDPTVRWYPTSKHCVWQNGIYGCKQ